MLRLYTGEPREFSTCDFSESYSMPRIVKASKTGPLVNIRYDPIFLQIVRNIDLGLDGVVNIGFVDQPLGINHNNLFLRWLGGLKMWVGVGYKRWWEGGGNDEEYGPRYALTPKYGKYILQAFGIKSGKLTPKQVLVAPRRKLEEVAQAENPCVVLSFDDNSTL